jgi:starvation-inducible DNA-binding protein
MPFISPVRIQEQYKLEICRELQNRLYDGMDLYSIVKLIHWNLKGENFIQVHRFLDELAEFFTNINDLMAERAVTLTGSVEGSLTFAAATSKVMPLPFGLPQYCPDRLAVLAPRLEQYLEDMRTLIDKANGFKDYATVNMLSTQIEAFEKHCWFVRSMLDEPEYQELQEDDDDAE